MGVKERGGVKPSQASLGVDTNDGSLANTLPRVSKKPETDADQPDYSFLQPPQGADEIGRLGTYRVLKPLGHGAMGIVFLAEDTKLRRSVALKVMRPALATEAMARRRFLREARAIATIRSDHILAIYEIGDPDGLPYIVTELLHGVPLSAWLKKNPMPIVARVIEMSLQIARGLEAAHGAGVIHRDIKPANMWVEEPSGRVKILDFGLARTAENEAELTHLGDVLGTPAYMAPEQAAGTAVDARCDLFSLGCVMYELASGVRPFPGTSAVAVLRAIAMEEPMPLASRRTDLPVAFTTLVTQLLAKDPAKRPTSAEAVVSALHTTGEVKPSVARTHFSSPVGRRRNVLRRHPIACAAIAALCLLPILAWLTLGESPDQAAPESPPAKLREKTAPPKNAARQAMATPGVTSNEVLLGMSGPFSGPARELGRDMEVGLRTCFASVNDQGGIAGRKLKLVSLDDSYQPDRALANMKELFEQRDAFAVIGNVGTATAETAMPYALSKQRVFFGAFTGAPLLRREPPDRFVFNFRASYAEESAAIVKYLIEVKGLAAEQIAVFAQQDGYGDAGFTGVVKTLRKLGRKPEHIVRVGHQRNSSDVNDAVQEILRHKEVRAVVMVSTYRPAAQFIRLLKDAKADLIFANISFVGSDALAEELSQMGPNYGPGVIVTQVVPHPESQSSLVLTYRAQLRKYHPNEKPGFGSLEGYIVAAIFAEGLKRAGENLSTETLVEALECLRNHDIGLGTPIHYGPSEHQASHKVWGTILGDSGNYRILDLQ